MLWPHTSDSLTVFLENLNSFHQNIKFTWEISHTKVVYLDLEIFKGSQFKETGKLDIQTHFKTTNTFQYLHYSSCHPRSTFKGIIKGETIRFIRTNTSETTFNSILCKITTHLRHRGYPLHFIQNSPNIQIVPVILHHLGKTHLLTHLVSLSNIVLITVPSPFVSLNIGI